MSKEMKLPEKANKPKKITTKAPPGGNQTPGAKADAAARQTSDNANK